MNVRRGFWFQPLTVYTNEDGRCVSASSCSPQVKPRASLSRSCRVNQSLRSSSEATGGIEFPPTRPPVQSQAGLTCQSCSFTLFLKVSL